MPPLAPPETVARLVRETALAYHDPETAAAQSGLTPARAARILADPAVAASVRAARREIVESGEKFMLKNRRWAEELVEQVVSIAANPVLDPADRLRAVDLVVKWSQLVRPDGEASGTTVKIVTNLNLGAAANPPGVYAIGVPDVEGEARILSQDAPAP